MLAATLADALGLEVIYMVMLSFTSEMHLPQHCQIGLIHIGQAPVHMHVRVVCLCVWSCRLCTWVWIGLFPRWVVAATVIYQDGLCVCFLCGCIGWKIYSDPIRKCNS